MRKKGLIFLFFILLHKDASVIFENSTQPVTKIASKYGLYEIILIPLNVFILIVKLPVSFICLTELDILFLLNYIEYNYPS